MSVSGTLYTEKATLMEHFEKWTIYACGLMKHLIYNQLATNCQTRSLYCTVYWGESISPSSLLMFLPVSLSLSVSYTHLHTHTRSLTHSEREFSSTRTVETMMTALRGTVADWE